MEQAPRRAQMTWMLTGSQRVKEKASTKVAAKENTIMEARVSLALNDKVFGSKAHAIIANGKDTEKQIVGRSRTRAVAKVEARATTTKAKAKGTINMAKEAKAEKAKELQNLTAIAAAAGNMDTSTQTAGTTQTGGTFTHATRIRMEEKRKNLRRSHLGSED